MDDGYKGSNVENGKFESKSMRKKEIRIDHHYKL